MPPGAATIPTFPHGGVAIAQRKLLRTVIKGSGFRVYGLGFWDFGAWGCRGWRTRGSGFQVWGWGFKAFCRQAAGFRVHRTSIVMLGQKAGQDCCWGFRVPVLNIAAPVLKFSELLTSF